MRRILVVATSPNTRGGITSVLKAHEHGEQWEKYHCKWIISHIDKNVFIKIITLIWGLFLFLIRLPFSVLVHVHLSEASSAMRKSLFIIPARLLRKRIVVHFHSFSPETTIRGKYAWLYRWIFAHSDAVIVLSNYWMQEVNNEFCLGQKVKVIYNPCSEVENNTFCERENYILYAGALNHRKGYDDLLKAFGKINKKYPKWKVIFAGNGEIEKGKKIASELGISTQVSFLGWVTGMQKDAAYKKASIFCLPSYAEGFPMAVLDAWAYGLPVITTPVGGITDVAENGKNMLIFNPGDIEALAVCLEKMISDEDFRNRIALESRNFATTTFNRNTINKQICELYDSLIS
jgi:glycosyltransferase involved in cell wall biosynthesis